MGLLTLPSRPGAFPRARSFQMEALGYRPGPRASRISLCLPHSGPLACYETRVAVLIHAEKRAAPAPLSIGPTEARGRMIRKPAPASSRRPLSLAALIMAALGCVFQASAARALDEGAGEAKAID